MPSYLSLYLYLYCNLTQWRWTRVRHACWPCWGIWPVLRHSPTHASPRFVPVDIMIVATWYCDIMVILRHCDKEKENTNRSWWYSFPQLYWLRYNSGNFNWSLKHRMTSKMKKWKAGKVTLSNVFLNLVINCTLLLSTIVLICSLMAGCICFLTPFSCMLMYSLCKCIQFYTAI